VKKKNKADQEEGSDDSVAERLKKTRKKENGSKKRGRKPKGKSFKDRFKAIWHTVRSATDEHGRVLSALFMDLPLAEDYPDYYDVIKDPISLAQIKSPKFTNKEDFKSVFLSIFSNAQVYNEVGSQVYDDAEVLRNIFLEEFNKKFSDEYELEVDVEVD